MSMLVHELGLSRRACDRCHGQKLRCKRDDNNQGCIRCAKAGVQCTPRPVRSRHRARPQTSQQAPAYNTSLAQPQRHTAIDQTDKEDSESFEISPTSFLGIPPDLDLGLDSSSLQSEAGPVESSYLPTDIEHTTLHDRQPNQGCSQDSSQSSNIEPPQQESQGGPYRASRASTALSSFISTLLPYNEEAPSNHPRQRLPLSRSMAPESLNQQSETRQAAYGTSLHQRESATFPSDSEDIGTSSSYEQAASNHSRSASSGSHITSDRSQQGTEPPAYPVMTSWVRKLSDINVELHQDMLSIPPVEVGQKQGIRPEDRGTGNVAGYSQPAKKLAIDRTFKLSQQYTEMLNHIMSRCKSQQAGTELTTATLTLDQPTQLLVLCSYLCLVESYDKILQHIKGWTEARLNLGISTSDNQFPIRLPRLAIGSFHLPPSSSSAPLVLTCIIEAIIQNMHGLVSEMMKSVITGNGAPRTSHTTAGEQGSNGGDELGSVAKVTLQTIRTKEDATMELIHVVWRLALECDTA